ncbi:MAG: aspartate--tRNA(Asn) ligase [Candidatus Bathyarchaeota archaeon]|jgi:aspartyl-tRNA synthetase|nr:aspartate--tRNA(Asn) ligase [Candidatus Bathyarchaeota archaeon A05DMB-3]MDH7606253.1 aspartate--tRNA(Asn) ligase [Candidatus Bathyarchaeota archaeon]
MKLDSIGDWRRTHYSAEVRPELDGQEVTLFGWVQEIRDLGGIRFIILQDREGTVQITVPRKKVCSEVLSKAEALQKRYSIGVKGIVKKTEITPRGVEVIPKEVKVFSTASPQLPIDIIGKVPAKLEVRLDARPLDLCREENIAVFKIQHTAVEVIRDFLFERGFIEVHTPRIIASATEGGAALFPVDYFERKAFLAQSPQLYKEQLVISLERVFEVGPFFRAEESHTRRHLSEFVSIDIEQAFAKAEDVMQLLEQLMQHTCKVVNEKCRRELALLNYKLEVPETPFKRLTYDMVLEDLRKEGVEIPWGEDIPTPAFRTLGKIHPYFYFITDWPTQSKAFYIKPKDDNPELCEGFDFMWRWIELASGGTRIASKELLIKRLKEKGLNPESFKYHLQAFDYGMPPHAGWAIGLERLTMMLTGRKNIREATLYPRDKFRLTP